MSMARLTLIGVIFVCLPAVAVVGHAQTGETQECMEWLVANSDVMVRVTVVKVSVQPARGPAFGVWKDVEVDVHETLKGRSIKRFVFTFDSDRTMTVFEELKRSKQQVLCFFDSKPGEDPPLVWSDALVRLGPPLAGYRLYPPIFTVDLRLLKEPEDVLKAARAAVAEEGKGGRPDRSSLNLPRDIMQTTGRSGDGNGLLVPVDHRLEKAARHWIASPEDVPMRLGVVKTKAEADRFHSGLLRLEGIRALRNFKSDENIAILKGLLNSPDAWTHTIEEQGSAVATEKVYFLRQEAYETLRDWGIKVKEPVLRVPVPRHGSAK